MLLEGQAEFVWQFRLSGDPETMICAIGYAAIGDYVDETSVVVAQAAFEAWEDNLLPEMQENYTLVGCIQRLWATGEAGPVESQYVGASDGGVSDGATPQNSAYLIHKLTAGTGAGKNGRNYIPGVAETKVSNSGVLLDAWQTTWNGQLALFLEAFDGTALPLLVVNHGPLNPQPWDTVNTMAIDPVIGSQRRRLRR